MIRLYIPELVYPCLLSIEAIDSDWQSLNCTKERVLNYFSAVCFLLKTLFIWSVFGITAKHAFPFKANIFLLRKAISGNLGSGLQCQQNQARLLQTENELKVKNDAKTLNILDSYYWLITEVISLASPQDSSASISRIFQTVEVLHEKRTEVLEQKKRKGNHYKFWISTQKFWSNISTFLKSRTTRDYKKTEEILNSIIFEHINNILILQNTIGFILRESLINSRPNLNFFLYYIEGFLKNLAIALLDTSALVDLSINQLLESLSEESRKNPTLNLLLKIQIITHWASQKYEQSEGTFKEVIGGPVRVKQNIKNPQSKNKYHFSEDCDRYPRMETPEDKINCFNTIDEAEELGYNPCNKCEDIELIRLIESCKENNFLSQDEAQNYYESIKKRNVDN